MVHRYLGKSAVAARIGVKPFTLNRYPLPPADAEITKIRKDGTTFIERVWLDATIDEWNARRPGKRPARIDTVWHLPPEEQAAARALIEPVHVPRPNWDSGPVIEHAKKLRASGMLIREIADRAGVSMRFVERLFSSNPHPTVKAGAAEKLMAVEP